MSISTAAQQVSEELDRELKVADAFLSLYALAFDHPGVSTAWMDLGRDAINGRQFISLRDATVASLRTLFLDGGAAGDLLERLQIGDALADMVARDDVTPQASSSVVRAMKVLDVVMRGLHPLDGGEDSHLDAVRLRGRVRSGQPIVRSDRFQVFPRPRRLPAEERGQPGPNDLLANVCVIENSPRFALDYKVIEAPNVPKSGRFSRIGVVPTIHAPSELSWQAIPPEHYTVQEREDLAEHMAARLEGALHTLCEHGAELVVMPELVSGSALHTQLLAHLKDREEADLPVPGLIVAGTYLYLDEEKHRNRAHATDGTGYGGWHQDKFHIYQFTATEQARAGLPLGPATNRSVGEDPGRSVAAGDSRRIAVSKDRDIDVRRSHSRSALSTADSRGLCDHGRSSNHERPSLDRAPNGRARPWLAQGRGHAVHQAPPFYDSNR